MKRRRFLAISAAVGALAATPARAFRLDPVEWRGTALGAVATLTIHHEDRAEAVRVLEASLAELERLERIFSLYREDSALVQLNRHGRLAAPPQDLVVLLGEVGRYWQSSDGVFDPTVQPLWQAYARHFAAADPDPAGPPLAPLRALIGWDKVSVGPEAVVLRPGMALTLNGIAQGYITDRVADFLRHHGLRHVLVNLGEIRALGRRGDGAPWRVGLTGRGPMDFPEGAGLAVSWAESTRFSPRCHHLFDPRTASSGPAGPPTAIIAPTATTADALATLCAIAPDQAHSLNRHAAFVLEQAE